MKMGQTTLHYLHEIIFDIIKIDGSLVKGLKDSANCREIVSSLVELADSLSLFVIAEFVETDDDKELLHGMGCDIYQGYLYSPAVPLYEEGKAPNAPAPLLARCMKNGMSVAFFLKYMEVIAHFPVQ